MKTLLLAGIAALFLTTGTAHAKPVIKWQCGRTVVSLHESSFGTPDEHYSVEISFKPAVRRHYNFGWNPRFERKEIKEPNPTDTEGEWGVATGGGDQVYLNGKRCKDYVPSRTKKTGD
jgi:hypothetical protein